MDNIAAILKLGELGLLALVLIGIWRLAKPAMEGWLLQNRQLVDHLLEMTKALENLNADHREITELLRGFNGKKGEHNERTKRITEEP